MTVEIILTLTGADTGPFNLYSNVDGFTLPFESSIDKPTLEAGYTSSLVPDGTTIIRVCSINPSCTNCVDLEVITTTTTSTSSTTTTSTTSTSTSTTTTTSTSSTSTTTTTIAFLAWNVRLSNNIFDHCSETPTVVYTAVGDLISTGYTVYFNSALTIPVTGFLYIDELIGTPVYNLDNLSGLILSDAGIICPP